MKTKQIKLIGISGDLAKNGMSKKASNLDYLYIFAAENNMLQYDIIYVTYDIFLDVISEMDNRNIDLYRSLDIIRKPSMLEYVKSNQIIEFSLPGTGITVKLKA